MCIVGGGGKHQRLGCEDRNWLLPRSDLVAFRQGLLSCEDWDGRHGPSLGRPREPRR